MPQTIPFKDGFALGQIVENDLIKTLIEESKLQKGIDLANQSFENSKHALKHVEMLKIESQDAITENKKESNETAEDNSKDNLQEELDDLINKLQEEQAKNLEAYIKAKINYNKKLITQGNKEKSDNKNTGIINFEYTSPINIEENNIKVLPLSFDTLTANVQYVDFEKSKQSSESKIRKLEIAAGLERDTLLSSVKVAGESDNDKQSNTLKNITDIKGTLVISARATHKNVSMISPININPEIAIASWNKMYPDQQIDTSDPETLKNIRNKKENAEESGEEQKDIKILSGVTYGSSFVAYIHTLHSNSQATEQKVKEATFDLNVAMQTGAWLAEKEGYFGVDDQFSRSVRKSLDNVFLESFFDIIVRGLIPNIASTNVSTALKVFQNFNPKDENDLLLQMQNNANNSLANMEKGAKNSIHGQQMLSVRTEQIKATMLATAEIDKKSNSIINTNSVLEAFTDYVKSCRLASNENKVIGVPTNFYLYSLTAPRIVDEWTKQYNPILYEKSINTASKEEVKKEVKK